MNSQMCAGDLWQAEGTQWKRSVAREWNQRPNFGSENKG
jgi:hypothetical protein